MLIQPVTAQVTAFEVWSKILHWLQSGENEGTLPFVLFLVANVILHHSYHRHLNQKRKCKLLWNLAGILAVELWLIQEVG